MGTEENLNIAWKDFESNSSNIFKELLDDKDFTNVTLATADNKQIKAHKIILSFCSPFFKEILVSNPHQNPLLYLKGIRYSELESIIKFVYLGQCEVKRVDLEDFLSAARELQINGLTQDEDDNNLSLVNDERGGDDAIKSIQVKSGSEEQILQLQGTPVQVKREHDNHPPETTYRERGRRGLDMISRYEPNIYTDTEAVSYSELSDSSFNADFAAKIEIPNNKNENGKYPCDQCDYEATVLGSLKSHVLAKHTAIRFECDQCDYRATQKGSLKRHKASIHEGIKYSCDQCEYKALTLGTLKSHKEAKHDGVKYNCDMCEYQATQRSSLKRHQRNIHGIGAVESDVIDVNYDMEMQLN